MAASHRSRPVVAILSSQHLLAFSDPYHVSNAMAKPGSGHLAGIEIQPSLSAAKISHNIPAMLWSTR